MQQKLEQHILDLQKIKFYANQNHKKLKRLEKEKKKQLFQVMDKRANKYNLRFKSQTFLKQMSK